MIIAHSDRVLIATHACRRGPCGGEGGGVTARVVRSADRQRPHGGPPNTTEDRFPNTTIDW